MSNCSQCGTELPEGAAFCANCGAVVAAAAPGGEQAPSGAAIHDDHDGHDHGPGGHSHAPAGPALGGILNDWQSSASRPSVAGASSVMAEIKGSVGGGRPVPQLAMGLAGLAAAIALLFGISAIKALVDVFGLSDDYRVGGTSTVALLLIAIVGVVIAALWAAIAWLARGGSRITVPLVYVLGAASALGGLTNSTFSSGIHSLDVLGALAAIGCIALLFVPEVRGYLEGGPAGGRPASLVGAEALLLWFGLTSVLLGVAYILLGIAFGDLPFTNASKLYIVAVGMILAAGVAFVFASAVGKGDVKARLIVSAAAGVFFVLMAVAGNLGGSWFQVVLLIGIAALLWTAADARAAFGDAPLNISTGTRPTGASQGPPPAHDPSQPPL
ncbi:MAG: hypothetical protein JWM93_2894 [Frankiales bacterium]|nr:hypothetical protein [Frankiales bacterium]